MVLARDPSRQSQLVLSDRLPWQAPRYFSFGAATALSTAASKFIPTSFPLFVSLSLTSESTMIILQAL